MDAGQTIVTIVVASLGSGAFGAAVTAWLARRRTVAETARITVEAEKVEVETSSVAVRMQAEVLQAVYTQLERQTETMEAIRTENVELRQKINDHIRANRLLRNRIAQLEAYLESNGLAPLLPPVVDADV